MDDQLAALLTLIDERERSTRLVLHARASDERHRLLARRYLQSLDVYRVVLKELGDEPAPQEFPEVEAVGAALGVDVEVPG